MSVRADVDRGLEIRDQIEKLQVELKEIDARLKDAALHGDQVELTDADREGRQFLANGSGRIVPVILTADMIMGEMAAHSKKCEDVKAAACGQLLDFFKPVNKFVNLFDNGKKFRAAAGQLLGDKAPAFITACVARDKDGIPKSSIKIMWDESKAK